MQIFVTELAYQTAAAVHN